MREQCQEPIAALFTNILTYHEGLVVEQRNYNFVEPSHSADNS